jgi:acetyl esterase/lipase
MDVYYPKIYTDPWPVVVYIHGGGWTGGDKHGGVGFMFVDNLVAADYLVVSINYRLAPDYKWPAMIEDVKCAIRSLRANAADFHLDPNRIGVYGTSAGGYLAAFLGTSDAGSGFDTKGGYLDQSSRVQAVVDMCGPIDIRYACQKKPKYGEGIFGKNVCNDQALLAAFSPMSYASPDDPPFMLVHGDRDTTVPLQQSLAFFDVLNKVGIPVFLVEVENAGHCFSPMGGQIDPTYVEITQMLIAFFDITLK